MPPRFESVHCVGVARTFSPAVLVLSSNPGGLRLLSRKIQSSHRLRVLFGGPGVSFICVCRTLLLPLGNVSTLFVRGVVSRESKVSFGLKKRILRSLSDPPPTLHLSTKRLNVL